MIICKRRDCGAQRQGVASTEHPHAKRVGMLKDLQKTQSSIRARHRCPVAQVRVFAHTDLSGASAGDLFAFSLSVCAVCRVFSVVTASFGTVGSTGFFAINVFCLYRGHGWRGFGARHGDHVGALHADLLQVFFIGLGVVAQVFAGFTVNRDDQVVGLLRPATISTRRLRPSVSLTVLALRSATSLVNAFW